MYLQAYATRPEVGQVGWLDNEIAEISFLLPSWQAAQLEEEATLRGVTVGQLLRCLIRDHLTQQSIQDEVSKL